MNKTIKTTMALTAIVTVVLGMMATASPLPSSNSHVSAYYETSVCVYKNGAQIGDCTHNTMMNAGLNWTVDKLFGTNPASGTPTVIALGNKTSAETATLLNIDNTNTNAAIPDCGLAPATITGANLTRLSTSTANVSLTYQWTSTCATIVNTTALYNQTSGAALNMFAGKNFASPVTLANGDSLNVTWYVWATGG